MYIGIFFITLSVILFGFYLYELSKPVPNQPNKTNKKKIPKKKDTKTQPKRVFEKVSIYYATESGTAEGFACSLAEDAMKFKIPCKVMDIKDVDPQNLKNDKLAIFQISTHFEGDPPTNSENFNKDFVKIKETDESFFSLENLKYVVYGLGDITYTYYGKFSVDFDAALEKRKATRLKNQVIGSNDKNNIADHFADYKEGFWSSIIQHVPMKDYDPNEKDDDFDQDENLPKYKFITEATTDIFEEVGNLDQYEIHTRMVLQASKAKVIEMKDLRQRNTETGRTIHIEMKLPDGVSYDTAANLILYPENSEENVNKVLKEILELDGNQKFKLTVNKRFARSSNIKRPFPDGITVKEYLQRWIDLQGVLKKSSVKNQIEYIKDENTKKTLTDLMLLKNRKNYNSMIKKKYGLIDILTEFNIKLKLEELIDIGTHIQPRYYTIASSAKKDPTRVALCISLTIDDLGDQKKYGLTSNYLCEIFRNFKRSKSDNSSNILVNFQKSNFVIPTVNETSSICISTGAGFAPFKAFIDEKRFEIKNSNISKFGKMFIFFGCRNRDEDYIYKEEMMDANSDSTITALHEAFSREEEKKYYVQDILKFKPQLISDILFKDNGIIYLCGNTGMSKNIKEVIKNSISGYQKKDYEETEEIYRKLLDDKKICVEAWG